MDDDDLIAMSILFTTIKNARTPRDAVATVNSRIRTRKVTERMYILHLLILVSKPTGSAVIQSRNPLPLRKSPIHRFTLRNSKPLVHANPNIATASAQKPPSPRTISLWVRLALFQVVARYQARCATLASDLGLPPAVVLAARDREDVTFGEGKLFRNGSRVHVHCSCYKTNQQVVKSQHVVVNLP